MHGQNIHTTGQMHNEKAPGARCAAQDLRTKKNVPIAIDKRDPTRDPDRNQVAIKKPRSETRAPGN